ncbi:mannitol-1-phosphate 5-dehydrogenase [[Mycoplasma] collis]|uniref:mannitol-1-phosphate 5-dehydrogenase n=1 Tax=[Mycoplasma] collis TaxID=2127 RepID=UPI00051C44E7|nr:mannitol-1-phosphate 5-dehydrogenase [[Mycoplasma] collis]
MKKNKVIHFGAGNIGRGLIAYIYQLNNYEVYFVDTNSDLIKNLQKNISYKINYFNYKKFNIIKNYQALHIDDVEKIKKILSKVDIISTSVKTNNLPFLKKLLISVKLKNNVKIICFENGYKISDYFKNILNLENKKIKFINAMIDRIIPYNNLDSNSLDIKSEKYYEIILEKTKNFTLEKVSFTNNIDLFITKKLILFNAIHTLTAILAFNKNYLYVHQAFENIQIVSFIKKFIKQLIYVFSKEFLIEEKELKKYVNLTIKRIKNSELKDLNSRLIRNLSLKFTEKERFGLIFNWFKKYKIDENYFKIIFTEIYQNKQIDDQFFLDFFMKNKINNSSYINNELINIYFQKLKENNELNRK